MPGILRLICVAALVLGAAPPVFPQSPSQKRAEAEWEALTARFLQLHGQGRHEQATRVAEEALRLAERAFGPNDPYVASSLTHVALALEAEEKHEDLAPILRRALKIREEKLGAHADTAKALSNLGRWHLFSKQYAKAEPLFKRALEMREALFGEIDLAVAGSLHDLAGLYMDQNRNKEAEPLIKRELAIWERKMGYDDPLLVFVLDTYAELARRLGDMQKAASLEARAERVRQSRDAKLGTAFGGGTASEGSPRFE